MKRFLQTVGILVLVALALPAARAQQGFPFITLPNDTTTGTQANHLASVTGGNAIITTAGAASGAIGVSTNGGTQGTANIQYAGQVSCTFDGGTTAGDYVTISAGTNGDCTDTGATTCPATQPIGVVFQTHTGAGTYPILLTVGGCIGAGGSVITGTGTAGDVTVWSGASALNNGPAKLLQMRPTTSATDGVISFNGTPMLFSFPSGNNNTFLGSDSASAGNFSLSGSVNVGIGEAALASIGTGGGNTGIGYHSLNSNIIGNFNTALGQIAGSNITGDNNTAIGQLSCSTLTTGTNTICIGVASDVASAAVSGAVAIGAGAVAQENNGITVATGSGPMLHNFGTGNIFLGQLSGNFTLTGTSTTGLGVGSLTNLTTGVNNTAVGNQALVSTTTAGSQTAVGINALSSITTAGSGTAVGASALALATGADNTAVGASSCGTVTSGTNNTCLGFGADTGAALTNSTAIGNGAIATASNSVMVGNTSVVLNTLHGRVQLGVVHFASLGAVVQGQTFLCDDCDPETAAGVANQCTSAGAKTGAIVQGGLTKWMCNNGD